MSMCVKILFSCAKIQQKKFHEFWTDFEHWFKILRYKNNRAD